jgi:hypothetical protein
MSAYSAVYPSTRLDASTCMNGSLSLRFVQVVDRGAGADTYTW